MSPEKSITPSEDGQNSEESNVDLPEDGSNTGQHRRWRILELLASNALAGKGATEFQEVRSKIADEGKTSPTLHNDLKRLVELGLVEKISRGAYRLRRSLKDTLFEGQPYGNRQHRFTEQKERVAEACLKLLAGQFCFICQGTSTEPLFRLFRVCDEKDRPQSVVTNSLPGMLELLGFEGIQLTIIGGEPDRRCGAFRPIEGRIDNSTEDPVGEKESGGYPKWLGTVEFNVLVLSCSGLSPQGKIWCGDQMGPFRKALLAVANKREAKIIVLADHDKVTTAAGGVHFETIDWKKTNVWLFVDEPKKFEDQNKQDAFKKNCEQLKSSLQNRLVLVKEVKD